MKFTPDELDRMAAVLRAPTTSFAELVRIAGLDPARDLRGADLRGLNFRTDDLTGFDFAGADLTGTDLSSAVGLCHEMFDGARHDQTTRWPPQFWSGPQVKPDWASAFGRDRFGIFADFTLPNTDIVQRLRWIPPGSFLMGSPEDEPGRFDVEGPRHQVTLAQGFWLFDTPCTQALWRAVMGNNPSRFKSDRRPVETVSFEAVQAFLVKLNRRLPGLDLTLPSEAQWEYACRAGTDTATYAGAMEILGERNAPVLDGIAWYGGNSGVDFDPPKGFDSRDWIDKQYPHEQAGTRSVAQKVPNRFGLYDMLGNVWEWCLDHWHDTYEGAPSDGSAWIDADRAEARSAPRVLRGGSWNHYARDLRSAYRGRSGPSLRYVYVGFRCARVQSESAVAGAASGASRRGGATRGTEAPRAERAGGNVPRGAAEPKIFLQDGAEPADVARPIEKTGAPVPLNESWSRPRKAA